MKKFLFLVLQKVLAEKLASIFLLLTPFLLSCLLYFRDGLAKYLSDPTGLVSLVAIGTTLSTVTLSLAAYFYHRPKFIEHRGAHFKKNKDSYHEVVYCGDPKCLLSVGANTGGFYVCKCGWKAPFGKSSLQEVMSELP